MALWLLQPVADPDDPWWQGRLQFSRVVVRAATPAFARVLAETLDTPETARESGQENAHLGSGFKDEKLYRVVPFHGEGYGSEGPDEILDSTQRAAPSS